MNASFMIDPNGDDDVKYVKSKVASGLNLETFKKWFNEALKKNDNEKIKWLDNINGIESLLDPVETLNYLHDLAMNVLNSENGFLSQLSSLDTSNLDISKMSESHCLKGIVIEKDSDRTITDVYTFAEKLWEFANKNIFVLKYNQNKTTTVRIEQLNFRKSLVLKQFCYIG